jgi:hypothetical protein
MQLLPQPEPDPATPEKTVTFDMPERDAETIAAIRAIVSAKMQDEPYWGHVVLDVLQSYNDRGKGLSDWWIYSRFLATFGAFENGCACTALSCWKASSALDELLLASEALRAFESWGWFKQLRYRRIQRQAHRDLLTLLSTLNCNHANWCDEHEWLKYSNAKKL